MKKNWITASIFVFTILLSCVVHSEPTNQPSIDIEKYRSYPFQWVFPEYYYKANIIPVIIQKKKPEGYVAIDFFGLKSWLPEKYTQKIEKKNGRIIFRSLDKGKRIIFIKSSDSSYMCKSENIPYQNDYCSSFRSVPELFDKLYTLTPDTALTVGDKWIVHSKGHVFQEAKKIEVYSGDKFIAYVKFLKNSFIKEINYSYDMTLFHTDGPYASHVVVCFPDEDEQLLKHFLQGLE